MNVAVFGAGYVGLVTGAVFADLGHDVILVEVSQAKIEAIREGRSPIYEAGLDSMLSRVVRSNRLKVTDEPREAVAGSDVIFVTVGTPPLPNGEADMRHVRDAALAIGRSLSSDRRRVIVNKATVPIGSANLVEIWIQDGYGAAHPGETLSSEWFAVASNPEFLREGTAIDDTLYADRIVIGTDKEWAVERLRELYDPIVRQSFNPPPESQRPPGFDHVPLIVTDRISAELIKYAANAFLATKISFANEIANVADRVGADVKEVMRGIGLDARIGPRFLNAGIGWGGSCLGKDLAALTVMAENYGYVPRLLKAAADVNRDQRLLAVKLVQEELKTIKGRRVALWGLAFKPGTDDLRDAPSLTIIDELLRLGARVRVYDPVAMDNLRRQAPDLAVEYARTAYEALEGADALILVTEWPEFREVPPQDVKARLTQGVVIDGRNLWEPGAMRAAGLRYRAIGR
ncbi:MAG: UDP-glucose/GDP-mannose dehydrogenase family protein [Firmicutes bacterium]|nr:UDP-glucose/GDP-mannose dehydrogenase family protein [Bacillota bacterium]